MALGVVLLAVGIALGSQPVGYGCVTFSPDDSCPPPAGIVVRGAVIITTALLGALLIGGWLGWTARKRARAVRTMRPGAVGFLRKFGLLALGVLLVIFGFIWASQPTEFVCGGFDPTQSCESSSSLVVDAVSSTVFILSGVLLVGGWIGWQLARPATVRRSSGPVATEEQ